MKIQSHRYSCVCCSIYVDGKKIGTPSGWAGIMLSSSQEREEKQRGVLVCPTCLAAAKFVDMLQSGGKKIPDGYLPYKEVVSILCDGSVPGRNRPTRCKNYTEMIVSPPELLTLDSIPWGAWVTCTRGLPVPAETHFCLPCSQRLGLFPSSGQPIKKDGPPTGIGGRASGDLDLHFS